MYLAHITDQRVLDTFKNRPELWTTGRYVAVKQVDSIGLKMSLKYQLLCGTDNMHSTLSYLV